MPVSFRCSGCQTRLPGGSILCPKCGEERSVPDKPASRYLIAGAGLALLLCIGAVVVANSFGDGKPDEEQTAEPKPPEEKPGTQVAIQVPGDGLGQPLIPPLDLTPPAPKEKPPAPPEEKPASKPPSDDNPPKKPAIEAPPVDPPAVVPADPPPAKKLVVKRRQNADAEALRKQLLASSELHIGARTSQQLVAMATVLKAQNRPFQGPTVLTSGRADLAGLPMRMGQDCNLGKEPAENLQVLSRKLRVLLEMSIPKDGIDTRPDPAILKGLLVDGKQIDAANPGGVGFVGGAGRFPLLKVEGRPQDWLTPGAVPALMQLLQAENTPVRTVLVEVLGKIKGKAASEALANRALMDLSPEVRELAVAELKARPVEEYAPALLQGLRYPWAAVAEHAAETLVALKVETAVTPVVKMLGENDPALPVTFGKGPTSYPAVREVVRINHLGNCVLCHAPSTGRDDLVRGAVPTIGVALPAPATTPQYYERGGSFVRADVTYLKQDFSVVQPVPNHGPWPANQRFDYMVRYRRVTATEIAQIQNQVKERKSSPHKESMLFVLRELTGTDLGNSAADWALLLPPDANKKQPSPEQP